MIRSRDRGQTPARRRRDGAAPRAAHQRDDARQGPLDDRGLGDAAAVELVEERGGTHNGMVFASLRRSLQAIARDVAAAG